MKKIVLGVVLIALGLTVITACKSRSLVGTGEESSYDTPGKATDITAVSPSAVTSKDAGTSTKSRSGGRDVVIDAEGIFADSSDNAATERQTQTGATAASSVKPSAASSTRTNSTSITTSTSNSSTTVRTNAYDPVNGWSDLTP